MTAHQHATPSGRLAVYAGSFDPPTHGHAWVIEKAAALFDHLIIAVAHNPEKRYTFALPTRVRWLRSIALGTAHTEVASIENAFLAHYARDVGARYVIRGIRNEADYQYERAMRYVNTDLHPGLTTIFLIPPRQLCEVSSSFVKGMIGPAGWHAVVRDYVPEVVYDDLVRWSQGHPLPD